MTPSERVRRWRQENPEKARASDRHQYDRRLAALGKSRRTPLTPEQKKIRARERYLKWVKKHPGAGSARARAWVKINPERYQATRRKWSAQPQNRIGLALRSRLKIAVRRGSRAGSAVRDLGCSIEAFKAYIESLFSPGMSWSNYGQWHFDHIRPLVSFDLTDREQFLQAVHYTNLQPLWAADNIRKGARTCLAC